MCREAQDDIVTGLTEQDSSEKQAVAQLIKERIHRGTARVGLTAEPLFCTFREPSTVAILKVLNGRVY